MAGCGWRLGDQRKMEQGTRRVDVVPATHHHSTEGTQMMESTFPGRGRGVSGYGKGPARKTSLEVAPWHRGACACVYVRLGCGDCGRGGKDGAAALTVAVETLMSE